MKFSFTTEDELVNAAIRILRARGFRVVSGKYEGEQGPPLKLTALASRLGISSSTVTELLNHRDCPPFNCRRTPAGQIRDFHPNPAVSAWLIQRLGKTTTTP